MNIPFRLIATVLPVLILALLLPVGPGGAQDATPPASDPCLTAAGAWTPWPMGPDMMRTPGAMGPGMMTPGTMGPGMMGSGMMGDVDLMVATMLLAHDRVDAALAQAAQTRVADPALRRLADEVAQARAAEGEQLQAWRGVTDVSPAGTPAAAAGGATVEAYDIYFEPRALTIAAGTDVTLTLPNEGVTLHNVSIDALGISVDIAAGATETVTINAPAGSYEYYCNVPGHKPAGMVGALTAQ